MTYRELAALAGVSPATVSKALADGADISTETRERIRALAEKHGIVRPRYHRNGHSFRVAILVPEIISVFYAQRTTELIELLRREGCITAVYVVGFEYSLYCRTVRHICDERLADGILSIDQNLFDGEMTIPILSLALQENAKNNCIYADYSSGLLAAVQYLCKLGHRRIGYIGEKNTAPKNADIRHMSEKLQFPLSAEDIFVSAKRFEEAGVDGARYFLKQPSCPTALVAAYDEIAIGAMKTFAARNIRVPEDVSVIGINDIPGAMYTTPPLTTLRIRESAMIYRAVQLLMQKMQDPTNTTTDRIPLQCELIVRKSAAPPRETAENP